MRRSSESKKRSVQPRKKLREAAIAADAPPSAPPLIWPLAGVTQSDLAEYFRNVWKYAGEYFEGRPVSFLCAPQGVNGSLHFAGGDAAAGGAGQRAERTILRTEQDFVDCAERRVVEMYAANYSLKGLGPDQDQGSVPPDFLILDFDGNRASSVNASTQQNSNERLRSVANVARELFDELGLKHVWKTSGRSGLHLMVPIQRQYEHLVVYDFSILLAEMIHERIPHYSRIHYHHNAPLREALAPSQSQNQNRESTDFAKVTINCRRNLSHQRLIAPFSPRAGERPAISLPISWETIKNSTSLPVFDLGDLADDFEDTLLEASLLLRTAMAEPNDLEGAFAAAEWLARKAE